MFVFPLIVIQHYVIIDVLFLMRFFTRIISCILSSCIGNALHRREDVSTHVRIRPHLFLPKIQLNKRTKESNFHDDTGARIDRVVGRQWERHHLGERARMAREAHDALVLAEQIHVKARREGDAVFRHDKIEQGFKVDDKKRFLRPEKGHERELRLQVERLKEEAKLADNVLDEEQKGYEEDVEREVFGAKKIANQQTANQQTGFGEMSKGYHRAFNFPNLKGRSGATTTLMSSVAEMGKNCLKGMGLEDCLQQEVKKVEAKETVKKVLRPLTKGEEVEILGLEHPFDGFNGSRGTVVKKTEDKGIDGELVLKYKIHIETGNLTGFNPFIERKFLIPQKGNQEV